MTRLSLAGLLLATLAGGTLLADDPKLPDAKTFDKLVVDTLKDVHNEGADLYNKNKDYNGAYRMFQGALLTVRPLLAHQPAAKKLIDEGLAEAEREVDPAFKAIKLHLTIENVRHYLRTGVLPKTEEKKTTTDKKTTDTETKKSTNDKKTTDTETKKSTTDTETKKTTTDKKTTDTETKKPVTTYELAPQPREKK